MKYALLLIIATILMLSTSVFSYTMFVADPTITPSAMNPLTSSLFFKFNIDINAQAYTSGPVPALDFNSNSLVYYSLTDSNTPVFLGTFNVATFKGGIGNLHLAQNGDYNFKIIISNGQQDVNYETGWVHAWSDENAPTSTYGTVTNNGTTATIPIYCRDGMTAQVGSENSLPETQQGSGCAGVWYYDTADGNVWNWLPGYAVETGWENSVNIIVTGTGDHTIYWCVEDRLDTNSCNGPGEWYKDIRITPFQSGTCALTGLLPFALIVGILLLVLSGIVVIYTGNAELSTLVPIGVGLIIFIIVLMIISFLMPMICVI